MNILYIEKSKLYDFFRPLVNDGLFVSTGNKWDTRRKILTPAFHFTVLEQFSDVLRVKESNQMIKSLKKTEDMVIKELVPFLSEHTLNVSCETAMGISLDSFGTLKSQYREVLLKASQIIPCRIMNPWLHLDWIYTLTPLSRKQAKMLNILHGFTGKVIKEKQLYRKRTNNQYLKDIESNRRAETDDVEVIGST